MRSTYREHIFRLRDYLASDRNRIRTTPMNKATNMKHLLAVLVGMALLQTPTSLAAEPGSPTNDFAFESRDGALAISFGGQRVADYVYRDEQDPAALFREPVRAGRDSSHPQPSAGRWQGPDRPRHPASGRVAGVRRRQRPGLRGGT